jgi:hypothetical protein
MSTSAHGGILHLPTITKEPDVSVNSALEQIGSLISGVFEMNVAATSSPYTLVQANEMTIAEYQAASFRYYGTRSAVLTVIHDPLATPRLFVVFNDGTTKTLTVKVTGGGAGVDVASGERKLLTHDGTNVMQAQAGLGTVIDSTLFASLSAAVTAIGSAPLTLNIVNAFPSGATVIVPSTLVLKPQPGGSIVAGSGHTVTIRSDPSGWPQAQLFSGPGTISFSGSKLFPRISTVWFGSVGDGVTDDRAAVLKAWNAAIDGSLVYKPDGHNLGLASTLTLQDKKGVVFLLGPVVDAYVHDAADVTWLGGANDTMIEMFDCGSSAIIGGKFYTDKVGIVGIDFDKASVSGVSTSNSVFGCGFNFVKSDANTVGVRIAFTSNNNNERMKVQKCRFAYSPNSGSNVATNTSRGVGIKVGDLATSKGFNVLNFVCEDNYFFGCSSPIDFANAGASQFYGNESNLSTIDYKLTPFSASSILIVGHRSESARQFMTQGAGVVELFGNEIGSGDFDSSGTYPVISSTLGLLKMDANTFVGTHVAGVKYLHGNSAAYLIEGGNSYLDDAQHIKDLTTFVTAAEHGLGVLVKGYEGDQGGNAETDSSYAVVWNNGSGVYSKKNLIGLDQYNNRINLGTAAIAMKLWSALTANLSIATPKLLGSATGPSIAAEAGAGSSPTVAIVGHDLVGEITVTTGTGAAGGALAKVTFHTVFAHAPFPLLQPANDDAAMLEAASAGGCRIKVTSTTTDFTISVMGGDPADATTYKWNYFIPGRE